MRGLGSLGDSLSKDSGDGFSGLRMGCPHFGQEGAWSEMEDAHTGQSNGISAPPFVVWG